MLRAALAAITVVLLVAPLAYGLYVHGWDVSGYVVPDLSSLLSLRPPSMSIAGYEGGVDLERGVFRVEVAVNVTNPLPCTLRIENLTFKAYCAEHGVELGGGGLRAPVAVGPGESRVAMVDLELTPRGVEHVALRHTTASIGDAAVRVSVYMELELRDLEVRVDIGGVEVNASLPPRRIPLSYEYAVPLGSRVGYVEVA